MAALHLYVLCERGVVWSVHYVRGVASLCRKHYCSLDSDKLNLKMDLFSRQQEAIS